MVSIPLTMIIVTLIDFQKSYFLNHRVVNQVINVVKQTEVKNTVIKSPRLAVIDIKKDKDDAPAKKGIVAFSLPSSDRNSKSKGLQNCSLAINEDDKEDTFLMVSWDLLKSIVVISWYYKVKIYYILLLKLLL